MVKTVTLTGREFCYRAGLGLYTYNNTSAVNFDFIHFILRTATVPTTFWAKEEKGGGLTIINGDSELKSYCYYMKINYEIDALSIRSQTVLQDVVFTFKVITSDTPKDDVEFLMKYIKEQS